MKTISFNKYRGLSIKGTVPLSQKPEGNHLDRASWLTAMVESGGKFGCCINYDGTGMTAGIHQAIAVYPKELSHEDFNSANDQGPLWKLLWEIYIEAKTDKLEFWTAFFEAGYTLEVPGRVTDDDGTLINGRKLRKELSGSEDGIVPEEGPDRERAEKWIRLFHELFSDPNTFKVQLRYGRDHSIRMANRRLRFSKKHSDKTIDGYFYGTLMPIVDTTVEYLGEAYDLAMAMFWSHNVNAPGQALKTLCKVADEIADPDALDLNAKKIIARFGNVKYGRWDDDIKNGRYQRTRNYAMQLWPKELFEGPTAIMPKDLPG